MTPLPDSQISKPPGTRSNPTVLAWLVIFIGIALRLRRYLEDRGLMHDDAQLATNIFNRSFGQLLHPLTFGNQAAPVGFVFLQKCAVEIFGHGERAIRLAPFLASILLLPILFLTLRKSAGPFTALFALAWVALSEPLVQYAAEGKQYSTDVLCTMIVVALAIAAQTPASLILLGVVGAILIWFSNPILFVLGAVAIALLVKHLMRRQYRLASIVAASGAAWLGSFVANYLLISRFYAGNDYLRNYWREAGAFAPVHLNVVALLWYPKTIAELFNYPLGIVPVSTTYGPALFLLCRIILLVAVAIFILGCFIMARRSRMLLAFLIFTLLFAIAASALERYPFSERLTLFIAPLVILPFAYATGIDFWRRSTTNLVAGLCVVALLFLLPVYLQAKFLIHPDVQYDLKPAMSYVKSHWRPGDALYLHWGSDALGDYYLNAPPALAIPPADLIHGIYEPDPALAPEHYAEDLLKAQGRARVWILFSMGAEKDESRFEKILSARGRQLDHQQFPGSAADLYDLQ